LTSSGIAGHNADLAFTIAASKSGNVVRIGGEQVEL
jgi:hypothetical protein